MKPGTFTQMYIQLVFAVRNRDAVLTKEIRSRVFEYMSGILTRLKHKSIIINGTSNHVWNHIIKRKHSNKSILIILMKMRWYLINNSYLTF